MVANILFIYSACCLSVTSILSSTCFLISSSSWAQVTNWLSFGSFHVSFSCLSSASFELSKLLLSCTTVEGNISSMSWVWELSSMLSVEIEVIKQSGVLLLLEGLISESVHISESSVVWMPDDMVVDAEEPPPDCLYNWKKSRTTLPWLLHLPSSTAKRYFCLIFFNLDVGIAFVIWVPECGYSFPNAFRGRIMFYKLVVNVLVFALTRLPIHAFNFLQCFVAHCRTKPKFHFIRH